MNHVSTISSFFYTFQFFFFFWNNISNDSITLIILRVFNDSLLIVFIYVFWRFENSQWFQLWSNCSQNVLFGFKDLVNDLFWAYYIIQSMATATMLTILLGAFPFGRLTLTWPNSTYSAENTFEHCHLEAGFEIRKYTKHQGWLASIINEFKLQIWVKS